jgi:hypothetical protein
MGRVAESATGRTFVIERTILNMPLDLRLAIGESLKWDGWRLGSGIKVRVQSADGAAVAE